ncbi:DUF6055 domain-containing protein [bacterium]|nr:DUF6055 domain-containing protein [bacterium]
MGRAGFGSLVLVCALFAFAAFAHADDFSPRHASALIANALEFGSIDKDTAAVYEAWAWFAPDRLPAEYRRAAAFDDTHLCGTPVITRLRGMIDGLAPWAANEIRDVVPGVTAPANPKAPETPAAAALTDFGQAEILPNVHYTEHFAIRWGNNFSWSGMDVSAAEFGAILEFVWQSEVVDMGYPPAFASNKYFTDVYVGNSGNGAPGISFQGAYTTIYDAWPTTMSYIVIHQDIFTWDAAVEEIAAHEFFHVMQFTIGLNGCWEHMFGDGSDWGVEASAVWAEDEVYDDNNSYVGFVNYHFANLTHVTLMSFVNGGYDQYSRGIFWKYLSEFWGGRVGVHTIWNECHFDLWDSVGEYLEDQGTTDRDAFVDFALRSLFADFEEGSFYDGVPNHMSANAYPFNQSPQQRLPQNFGVNFVRFRPDQSSRLNIRFEGDETIYSRTIDWRLLLVKVRANDTFETEDMPKIDGVTAEATIDGFGDEWSTIYLIVAPLTNLVAASSPGADYRVKATEDDDPFPVGDDDDDDDDATDDDDDDDDDDDVNDDDDDNAGNVDCSDLLAIVYNQCGSAFMDGGDALTGEDAYQMCLAGSGPWECLDACRDAAGGCAEFADCAESECGVAVGSESDKDTGDDDDDDDDGGACGC